MSEIEKLAELAIKADALLAMEQRMQYLQSEVERLKEPKALKTPEVAKILGVSNATVVNWANQGLIPAIRSKNGYRYPSHRIWDIAEQNAKEIAGTQLTQSV